LSLPGAFIMRKSCVRKSIVAVLAMPVVVLASGNAMASEPLAGESDFTISANVALTSQYRFRGIMQSNNKPAVQGGFDISHSSGFYIGNCNSSITRLNDSDPDVSAGLEMNF